MKTILTIIFGLSIVLCVHTSSSGSLSSIGSNNVIIHEKKILENFNFGIVDTIRDIIEQFIQYIKNKFNQILIDLKETIAKTHAKIIAIYEESRSKLKTVTFKADLLIKTLKRKGGIYEECANNVEPELYNLKNHTIERLNKCADDYVLDLKEYENKIIENITKIEDQIDELRLAVVKCIYINPITTAKCLMEKLNEYKNRIEDILNSVMNAAKNAVKKGLETIEGVQQCNRDTIADAVIETEVIYNKLDDCLALTTTTSTTSTTTTTTTEATTTTTEADTTTTTTTEAETTTTTEADTTTTTEEVPELPPSSEK